MFQSHQEIFLQGEDSEIFLGNIAEGNFFLILEVQGKTPAEGQEILKQFKQDVLNKEINSLADFESVISEEIKKANLPSEFSLATGILGGRVLYLRTFGEGVVFLSRGGQMAQIISGENSASGVLKGGDILTFTVNSLFRAIGGEEGIRKLRGKGPIEANSFLKSQFSGLTHQNLIALFVQMEEESVAKEAKERPRNKLVAGLGNVYQDLKTQSAASGRKKFITLIVVALIFLVLIWSVVLGYQRREEARLNKRIETVRDLINKKLTLAEESSFANLPKALILITEAKQEIERLRVEVGDKKKTEIGGLENLIKNKENAIVKKEEKEYEEFFDLALDDEKAKGTKLYLDGENLIILDSKNQSLYTLSMEKKSLDKKSFPEIASSSLIASYVDDLFFYSKKDGIYKITKDGKPQKIIGKDNDWGEITDMVIYNGNIYLLDKGKDEVYKYTASEDNYSAKKSYFGEGEAIDLGLSNSIAIDSSIYIGFDNYIKKFTAGVRDGFTTSYPNEDINITKIFTNKNLERIYAWDKEKGAIYSLEKNGTYEKQINAGIFTQASDIVVYNKAIFALVGSKIYKVNLD